ncbi:NADP-dependent oxidoreductase [Pseudokineococcus sp. 1T1Z-3]|uniref:NADP-dependent oxidoreductase n=1 Tax=Pseudokineococcus sp. 1T1Z-3 TaxID=3132745 RepID=UPI0030AB3B08
MRAVVVTTPGGPEVLQLADVPDLRPGPGQVLVRVEAAAVNPVDLFTRSGQAHEVGWVTRPTVGLGWDVAGVVEELGAGVGGDLDGTGASGTPSLRVGTPVAGLHAGVDKPVGAYAEHVLLDVGAVAERPAGLDAVAAATVPLNATTASQALDLLGPAAGRRLLVTGAVGAVGAYAAQLAAERGFDVTGLARAGDAAFVGGLGAEPAASLPSAPTYDAVLDAAALGDPALDVVVDGGAYVGVLPPAVPEPVRATTTTAVMVSPDVAVLRQVLARTAAGEVPARVAATLPLAEAAESHRRLERGGSRGRVVLLP